MAQRWAHLARCAAKAGKTTARNNLVKSLADGYDFLDKFQITRPEGAVVILDLELPEDMLRKWMRDIGIHNQQQLVVVPMRGKGVTLNLGLPEVRARWVARLREWGASVVILD
jgi:RecA-family ATPase